MHDVAAQIDGSDCSAVVGALEQQLVCYRALAKLAARQHEHVQNDHTEGLLEVLKEREVLLERLNTLEASIGPARRDWGGFCARLSPPVRARTEGLMAEAKGLLAEITSGDEKDAIVLQQRKLRIGNEIRATSVAAVVNRSYASSAYGRGQSFNLDRRT